jgi:uncharacterized protein YydD (DUF2326 family)
MNAYDCLGYCTGSRPDRYEYQLVKIYNLFFDARNVSFLFSVQRILCAVNITVVLEQEITEENVSTHTADASVLPTTII